MAKGFDDFKYLLAATCEIINFVLVLPIETIAAQIVVKVLIHELYALWAYQNF